MVKCFVRALIFFLLPFAVWAQSPIDLSSIDFSEAEIAQSGPASFYLRNVALPDQTVSLSIVFTDDGNWRIDQIYPESDNYIPAGIILDFATVELTDNNEIQIDWIIDNGSILRGVLGLSGDTITVSSMFSNRGTLESATDYPNALRNLIENSSSQTDTLTARIQELKEEKAALQTVRENLEAENDALQSMIEALKAASVVEEAAGTGADGTSTAAVAPSGGATDAGGDTTVSTSASLLQSYIDKLDTLQAEITSLRAKVSSLEEQLSAQMLAIEGAADDVSRSVSQSLSSEVESAASSISSAVSAELDRRIDAAEAAIIESISGAGISGGAGAALPAESSVAKLQAQITDLTAENARLTAKMKQIEEEIRSSLLKSGFIAMMRPGLTETLVSGFQSAEAQLGLWRLGRNSASQIEKTMLFGKLLLPVAQNDNPVLYSFKARSTDPANEWVGLGLHIFVENVEKRGYGLGDSLLVWLTRDQEVYKNNYTYLQLYRSDDDVNMDRVMDAVIQEPITEFIRIEVLYQPVDQYITIAVDGEEKIRYKTWFGIDEGVEVALRSLGTAEFTDLRVTTTP